MPEISDSTLSTDDADLVHKIDRTEVIDHIYYMREGRLVLEEEHWDLKGWPPGRVPEIIEYIHGCFDRGGAGWGAFDGDRLVGIAVLDGRWYGVSKTTLDFYFLHISYGYRHTGIGRHLVDLVKVRAREMGAERLFVSGLPSLNTIRFYQAVGFDIADEVDPFLREREPEDIHMDMEL